METHEEPDNSRPVLDSVSYDSFSGSTEWSNEDVSPNNNVDHDNQRLSYYQTPASALRESTYDDQHYRSPNIVDYYTNDAWNANSTFSPTDEGKGSHSTYDQPSGTNYNMGTRSYQLVSRAV